MADHPLGKPPCSGCTACCRGAVVRLWPEDEPNMHLYETEVVQHPIEGSDVLVLRHKPDGSCVHLGENGCTIHDRAPVACRNFDCRHFFWFVKKEANWKQRRELIRRGYLHAPTLQAGRERSNTLNVSWYEMMSAKVFYGFDLCELLARL